MAYFTVELSSMLSAYAQLLNVRTQEQSFEIVKTYEGHDLKWHDNGSTYVRNWKYETSQGELFKYDSFDFFKMNNPNYLIDNFVYPMCLEKCGTLKDNITDNDDLNKSIIKQFLCTFWRHFYGYEIGQEDPLYWWALFKGWYDENIDFFIQNYQQMVIQNQNYITGLSKTLGNATANGNIKTDSQTNTDSKHSEIAGTADTPQDELDFKLNTGDPAQDYNFNYSSSVNGAKSHDDGQTNSESNQDSINKQNTETDVTARNKTIAELSRELSGFMNGIYLDLFEKAREYGLFMNVIH